MTAASELRQRKKKDKKPKEDESKDSSSPPEDDDPSSLEPSLWHVFVSHPLGFCLVKVLPFIALPYGIYIAYFYIVLQHPDWVFTHSLRPAVGVNDPRQLLIVGTMSSGTVQVATDLKKKLQLEVGHEDSDAQWSFVRDGTVSWFHGIRFLPPLMEHKAQVYKELCIHYTPNMGFHPRMYRPSTLNCTSRTQQWNSCWARECILILDKEWNCQRDCEINFQKVLHQVRNPLRTIESLVAKFCLGGMSGEVQPAFTKLLKALFPSQEGLEEEEELSCIEAASTYVVNYTNALLEARQEGYIDAMYKVEESTPCDVARLAGLDKEETTLYKPNYENVKAICDSENNHPAQELMESVSHQINVDLVKLTWSDLEGGKHGSKRPEGSEELVQDVKELFEKLGYDIENEMDAQDPVFDF